MGEKLTLRDRCKAMYEKMQRDAILRQGSPVDDLVAFVVAETGRSADHSLDQSLPLCCYFATEQDREEFIAAVQEAKPNMIAKRLSVTAAPPKGGPSDERSETDI